MYLMAMKRVIVNFISAMVRSQKDSMIENQGWSVD